MGIRGELYTTNISFDNRTYFFNVKENRKGDVFLQIVESKNIEGAGFDRHAIIIFEEDMQKFLQGLESSLHFIEGNRKKNAKRILEKRAQIKRAQAKRDQMQTNKPNEKTEKKHTRKVRVIPKKKS